MPGRLAVKLWSKACQVTSPRRRASSQAVSACSKDYRASSLDAAAICLLASIASIPSRATPIVSSSSTHVLYICGKFGLGPLEACGPLDAGGSRTVPATTTSSSAGSSAGGDPSAVVSIPPLSSGVGRRAINRSRIQFIDRFARAV